MLMLCFHVRINSIVSLRQFIGVCFVTVSLLQMIFGHSDTLLLRTTLDSHQTSACTAFNHIGVIYTYQNG